MALWVLQTLGWLPVFPFCALALFVSTIVAWMEGKELVQRPTLKVVILGDAGYATPILSHIFCFFSCCQLQ